MGEQGGGVAAGSCGASGYNPFHSGVGLASAWFAEELLARSAIPAETTTGRRGPHWQRFIAQENKVREGDEWGRGVGAHHLELGCAGGEATWPKMSHSEPSLTFFLFSFIFPLFFSFPFISKFIIQIPI
jgi:hypothetical protein